VSSWSERPRSLILTPWCSAEHWPPEVTLSRCTRRHHHPALRCFHRARARGTCGLAAIGAITTADTRGSAAAGAFRRSAVRYGSHPVGKSIRKVASSWKAIGSFDFLAPGRRIPVRGPAPATSGTCGEDARSAVHRGSISRPQLAQAAATQTSTATFGKNCRQPLHSAVLRKYHTVIISV